MRNSGARDTTASQAGFERLLAGLDAERERAGERYERVRSKLILYFQCRNIVQAEECADETLDRVARKLEAGEEIREINTFVFGIARLLLLEKARQQARYDELPAEIPFMPESQENAAELEIRLSCLRHCLAQQTPENRELILQYYQGDKRDRINGRQELATRLSIGLNVLRVRACRLREALQMCVSKCAQRGKKIM
jgi:DNA-directed RNA polymerase specialized sigma24 family protein